MSASKPERPIEVRQGIAALWIAIGVSAANSLINALVFRMQERLTWVVLELAISILLSWFFLRLVARGKSWARATYLIMKVPLSIGAMFTMSETWWPVSPLCVVVAWGTLFITF
ncbi:hypothetical protein [Dyella acidiphila]|uniref:EamA family transporter n=1 Tax=Dyella acidiphila TaxID=2775866 RepID=A0ABR9GER1_9GAMM|nr:hypothetical protein [Dyella acidiphila]MBE1162517.1 hypothetical protein [Dyella acidiphila]